MIWVTEQIAVSGTEITGGVWCELSKETGITAVLNLRSEHQDVFTPPMPTAYLWLPVEDFTDPSMEQLLIGSRFVDTAVIAGDRVLIHCKLGIGRSPTMAAAYLVWTGLSAKDAIRQVEEAPGHGYSPIIDRKTLVKFSTYLKEVQRDDHPTA
jgi:hypothetical protein